MCVFSKSCKVEFGRTQMRSLHLIGEDGVEEICSFDLISEDRIGLVSQLKC